MEKGGFIKEIQDGQQVDALFLVKEMSQAETRTGKVYLMLTVMDRSGELPGRVWDNAENLASVCPAGAVVRLWGQAQSYKGILQLKIARLESVERGSVDMAQFMPAAPGDLASMTAEITSLARHNKNPHLRALLLAFFSPPPQEGGRGQQDFFSLFQQAPAAKHMHHAYAGGLLEHSLAVARMAEAVAANYPAVDLPLLAAGALLHDIGKVKEFSFASYPFDYTDCGRLMGHMVLGVEMIQAEIARLPGFPEDLAMRLKHLVLSHHGRHEFGAPALPMMLEAFVLNFIDDLDAKINYVSRLADQARTPGFQWTDFQRTLERFLYVRGQGEGETFFEAGEEAIEQDLESEPEAPAASAPIFRMKPLKEKAVLDDNKRQRPLWK